MFIVVVFCATTFASECVNCICAAQKETKKTHSCCSTKTEKKCCEKENSCGGNAKKDCNSCMQCVVKNNDIENSATTNDNNISNSITIKLSDLSFTPINNISEQFHLDQCKPPGKASKIFLAISNFRI